ncbi:MAG: regulatory protein RecX [Gammaproteobacteria bacterium]|nr:regulatory protein RecX [Gammaproteobacteria bacterium]
MMSIFIRNAALNLLSRREHSKKELCLKLTKRFKDKAKVEAVVRALAEQEWCNEDRFIRETIHAKVQRGYGPLYIESYLLQRGIPRSNITPHLHEDDPMWLELAKKVKEKRFGSGTPSSLLEKAKWVRFLKSRGFASTHIQYALRLPLL